MKVKSIFDKRKYHRPVKYNTLVSKVYEEPKTEIKYIVGKRLIDGMLKITIIDKLNHTSKSLRRWRKNEDYFFYYDIFEKGRNAKSSKRYIKNN